MPRPNQQPNEAPSPSAGDADFMAATSFVPSQIGETEDAPGDPQQQAVAENRMPDKMVCEALGGLFTFVFGAIAKQRGEHWQIEPFEKEALSQSWLPLVQLMLNQLGSQEQGMIVLALMSTGAVIGGKLTLDATLRASKTESIRTPQSVA